MLIKIMSTLNSWNVSWVMKIDFFDSEKLKDPELDDNHGKRDTT